MRKIYIAALTAGTLLAGVIAPAATQLQGVDIYVTGNSPGPPTTNGGLGGFSPVTGLGPNGLASELRMFDDGLTNGDLVADDGIWTCRVTNLLAGDALQWKVASAGFGTVNTPDDNVRVLVPASGIVNFYLNSNILVDGYKPVTGSAPTADGICYDDQVTVAMTAATSIQATGSFQSELGGTDFTPGDVQAVTLTDAAAGGLGDGLYGGQVTGLPGGSYDYKITQNQSFTPPAFGAVGYSNSGGNLSFTVLSPSDVVTFTLDATKARAKAVNPAAVPGPPFYGQSTAWSTGYTAAEQLYDDGSNGDASSGDLIFSRTFTVATPGVYGMRVRQGVGASYPSANDFPFATTTPNQQVLVVLDRNTYADGYEPAGNFAVVLINSPRGGANSWERVAPVGQLAVPFGGSDWTPDAINVNMTDDAAAPDGIANDQIWSRSYGEFGAGTFAFKLVLNRTGTGATGYAIQGGGDTDGLALNNVDNNSLTTDNSGNTVISFDAVSGRVFVGAAYSAPVRPPAYFAGFTPVSDWMMY